MFGFSKKRATYETDVIENIIGVGLPNRNKFINYGDVADENVYSGYAIGRVFSEDQERLSFEFDAVYLYYLISILTKVGVPAEQSADALHAVFDNFEISQDEQRKFGQRLKDYESLDDEGVAEKFVENLNVADFPESYREPSRKTLGGQFSGLTKGVERFVIDELRAAKA
jgi:hypothetical protein